MPQKSWETRNCRNQTVTESLCEPGPVAGAGDSAVTQIEPDLSLTEMTWGGLDKQVNIVTVHTQKLGVPP